MFTILTPTAEFTHHYGHHRLTHVVWDMTNASRGLILETHRGCTVGAGRGQADLNLVTPRYIGRTRA